jgi:hypothetical protein
MSLAEINETVKIKVDTLLEEQSYPYAVGYLESTITSILSYLELINPESYRAIMDIFFDVRTNDDQ